MSDNNEQQEYMSQFDGMPDWNAPELHLSQEVTEEVVKLMSKEYFQIACDNGVATDGTPEELRNYMELIQSTIKESIFGIETRLEIKADITNEQNTHVSDWKFGN